MIRLLVLSLLLAAVLMAGLFARNPHHLSLGWGMVEYRAE